MENKKWTTTIKSKHKLIDFQQLKEVLEYKQLIKMFLKKQFIAIYKQTILGPFWIILNPLVTTVVFTVIFGNIANLSTDGIPQFLFYMSGNISWSLFASSINNSSHSIVSNNSILKKVYFPRLVIPISSVLYAMFNFLIQFLMFLIFYCYYLFTGQVQFTFYILFMPILILQITILGFGLGTIVAGLTTKFRDLMYLVSFAVQLWMYATPVVYSLSEFSEGLQNLIMLNPMTPIIEAIRYLIFGVGRFDAFYLAISWAITLITLFIGFIVFNKAEKTFVDTI